jgi:hypothetical protein
MGIVFQGAKVIKNAFRPFYNYEGRLTKYESNPMIIH